MLFLLDKHIIGCLAKKRGVPMDIIYKSIRTINYETQQISAIDTPPAFDAYVAELINHISNNTSVREYKTSSNSTEVIGNILEACANINDNDCVFEKMDVIARRLLLKETEAQSSIRNTNTIVQKGSLVQALLFDDILEKYIYLLAKVEHTEWVDDSDFTFKTGFSKDKRKIWKSCLFDLFNLAADTFYAKVYSDTKARYWYDGFLELNEMNSDEVNTERAFKAIDATLGHGFKGIISPDHTMIRNSFVVYMKNKEHIDYQEMVEEILGNYKPTDPNISSDKILDIKSRLLEQPKKKKFDSQFNVIGSAINARIKRVYPIYDGIDLKVNGDIKDLSKTIIAVEENGVRYIKIRTNNETTFNRFKF